MLECSRQAAIAITAMLNALIDPLYLSFYETSFHLTGSSFSRFLVINEPRPLFLSFSLSRSLRLASSSSHLSKVTVWSVFGWLILKYALSTRSITERRFNTNTIVPRTFSEASRSWVALAPRGHAAVAPARSLGYKRQVEIDVDAPGRRWRDTPTFRLGRELEEIGTKTIRVGKKSIAPGVNDPATRRCSNCRLLWRIFN